MKLLDFLNFIQPELLVPFLASFWGCGACQVRFREGLRRIYKVKIKIFSILDIYTHNFKSSEALENKYYSSLVKVSAPPWEHPKGALRAAVR